MLRTGYTAITVVRLTAITLLAALAAAVLIAAPARATIVLIRTTSTAAPSSQDANLYDWQGQWTSALDRNAPLPGQLPAWQVDVGLYEDWYQPPNSNIVQQNPTCEIGLDISGAPEVYTELNPCVLGGSAAGGSSLLTGSNNNPTPETLTPDLAAAGNGSHTVTVTAYDALGGKSTSQTFNVLVDNTLPSPPSMSGALGWQRGGEVITSTASTSGPSGIDGQECAVGSSPASWYPGPTADIAVTGNGIIPVQCTAVSGAGVSGATAEFDARLDNTVPTGWFVPRSPSNPTLAAVATAEDLSGVAGGQIQIHTPAGWQNLPTTYNPTTGQLTASIPDDGSLPDGNYALQATLTNAVGSTATITDDENGNPELVTEPVRIVTQLDVGQSHLLVKRCTVTRIRIHRRGARHQRPAARLVRRCSEVAVPHASQSIRLRPGQSATVSGLLQTVDGNPVADATVFVERQAPGWPQRLADGVTTDSQGRFTYRIPAGPSRSITFAFPGTATLRGSAAATMVSGWAKVRITASRQAQAGRVLRISGRVLGGYIPAGGVLVQLQYRVQDVPDAWAPFNGQVQTDGRGRWHVAFHVPASSLGYTYLFRAVVHNQNGWPFLTTRSNGLARTVI